ncbi:MAG: UDP-N-acetylmuramoyl-tripeptide--D-alanyl-D-alanine ligase [Leptospirales bacterium]|nr:UDP-N-acetylmuramoyl-tripeptide--D-alanyl-D-alanine ligase [Leptospirales bacterium]
MKARLNLTAGEAAAMCDGKLICGSASRQFTWIISDSREAEPDCLFVALSGERFDGHDFVDSLAETGKVNVFIVAKKPDISAERFASIAVILCDDTRAALARIAGAYRLLFTPRIAAITGTNGKTTVKELLHTALSKRFETHKNEKNYNNEIGVPFAVFALSKEHEAAVFELGMNHAGEISRLSKIVKPDIAVITNAGEGHLEFLGNVENVARAKLEIIDGLAPGGLLILNRDSAYFDIMEQAALNAGIRIKTFGLDSKSDCFPSSYSITRNLVELLYRDCTVTASLYGIHNVYNILAVIAVAEEFGLEPSETAASLASFESVDGRSAIIDNGYIIINDTYNSNPLSSRAAIASVKEIFGARRKIAALSDMRELGVAAPEYHREIGALAAADFDILCVYGEMSGEYMAGAAGTGCELHEFASKDDMSAYLGQILGDNDVVLVKGSRSTKMEEIVEFLVK